MASLYQIPKEIKAENKVALNLNMKQLIACAIGVGIDLAIYFTTHLEIDQMLMITLILVGGALVTTTKTIDGISLWTYIFSEVRKMAFHYDKRKYRTKNKISTSLNKKYSSMRNEDLQDKKIAKKLKAEDKKRRNKKTKLKAIY